MRVAKGIRKSVRIDERNDTEYIFAPFKTKGTLAYNLVRNFQIDSGLAAPRDKTGSRTNLFTFESLKTLRFEWLAVAGRVVNVSGAKVLKLCQNTRREQLFRQIASRLAA